ncbi:hypothetical protein AKJ09_06965 [Labilithrix luteola]|uniref:Type IV fimbrial biogenesis protein PilY1 n=1 Tax=Labilithrix luteola TaxID=1391654 RepID=A0A0K1Q3U0_9BACT|nr:hypothetical protein [Labilithrix luteola]AKV00302.1 hypothetical protein AKJ09_06965 [Labilithrix luteola]
MKSALGSFESTRWLVAASLVGLATLGCALASCAGSDETNATPAGNENTVPELDAGNQLALDAGCADAGDGGCGPRARPCAESDFCVVSTGVDRLYTLLDVWGSSERDVWAVGSGGTIIHWDGAAWTRVPIAYGETLRSVGGSGVSDVWVVSSTSLVLHSSGFGTTDGFVRVPPVYEADAKGGTGAYSLSKVWSPKPGTVYVGGPPRAVAPNPSDSLWRFRFDVAGNDAWEPVSTFCRVWPCGDVTAVWGPSESDLWVIGNGGTVRRSTGTVGDGGAEQWNTLQTTLTTDNLHGIWGSRASDVWIVGDRGTIRHWAGDGNQHLDIMHAPTTENLRAVWGSGPSDVWAVGDGGTIVHWDGTRWSVPTTTLPEGAKPRLTGVWGSGPDDVWVVGEATALHFGRSKTVGVTEDGVR